MKLRVLDMRDKLVGIIRDGYLDLFAEQRCTTKLVL